jgi:hypothetical protein
MTAMSKTYFVRGLIVDGAILVLLFLLAAASYQGRCGVGFVMPTSVECSFFTYLTHDALFLAVIASPLILLALILPPLLGYHSGPGRSVGPES